MRTTRYKPGRGDVPVLPWELETTGSDAALARITRALVRVGGWFSDAYFHGAAPEGRNCVPMLVWVPEGDEKAVEAEARVELREPANLRICLNDSSDRMATCAVCARRFNVGDGRTYYRLPRDARPKEPETCGDFCRGRLVGRQDPRPEGAVT